MSKTDETVLRAEGLDKSFKLGAATIHVLRQVDLAVRRGEFLAIMGASGSGKSTLLHILGLLDRPDRGRVFYDGQEVFKLPGRKQDRLRNRYSGFVFQFYHLLPELNVLENVLLPIMVGTSIWSWPGTRHKARQRAHELLDEFGLAQHYRQRPATLSGGERQRVAIARALVQQPKLLLADEPTGNLDSNNGKVILDLLSRLNKSGQTIIMVTHDEAVAKRADRILTLKDGKL